MSMNKLINEASAWKNLRDVLRGLLNRSFTKAGLAIASTNTKIKLANTVVYSIDGKFFEKSGVDNIAISGGEAQAVGEYRKYLVSLDEDQAVTATQGKAGTTSALARIPDLPDDEAPCGV